MIELASIAILPESIEAKRPQIIYVDGHPGSGKSTLCELIAKREGYKTITTGQIFCALGYAAFHSGINLDDPVALADLVNSTKLEFDISTPGDPSVSVNGVDLTGRIFTGDNKRLAGMVSPNPSVRIKMAHELRSLVTKGNWVFDRGNEVLPKADLSIWLDASIEVRAARRCAQLALQGEHKPYGQVLGDMFDREKSDLQSGLYTPGSLKNSLRIDNTNLGIEQTYSLVSNIINNRSDKSE